MKVRTDFVTNSSSSSFIIAKKNLTENQMEAIRENSDFGDFLGIECAEEGWNIKENDLFISGFTYMDNYDISLLLSIIGVKDAVWGDWKIELPNSEEEFEEIIGKTAKHESVSTWEQKLERFKYLKDNGYYTPSRFTFGTNVEEVEWFED